MRKTWNITREELKQLAMQYNANQIAKLTGFAHPTVVRHLQDEGIKAQAYRSIYAGLRNQIEILDCKRHGQAEFRRQERKNGRLDGYVCKLCQGEAGKRKRIKARKELIERAGGRCIKCGYDKCWGALEFHHRDPKEKIFSIGSYSGLKSAEALQEEIAKCDLLCANCHMEYHFYHGF